MVSLNIDLVPKGKFIIEQTETGIELAYKNAQGKKKLLGSLPSVSLLFLNSFISSCITRGEQLSDPEKRYMEMMYSEFFPMLMKGLKDIDSGKKNDE